METFLKFILALFIFAIVFFLLDIFLSTEQKFTGTIVDKHYKSETTSVGTGVVNTGNGTGVVTTVETDPEKFLVMVKTNDGKIYTTECEPILYYAKKIGDKISCHHQIGWISKSIWSSYGDF